MAVAADYSDWVRELDEYQSGDGQYDERLEASNESGKAARPSLKSRSGSTSAATTTRKMKPRGASVAPISQTEELQQEMKLLNWHKLANEAALKAAIIKTNKIKQEDSQFASALTQGEREERVQRAQQIIEEEQLKPLQVNTEFFRNLEAKGQRDEAKLDDDVQRHIQHLRKLKESMMQREDMQRRRQQYREKMQELQAGGNDTSRAKAKGSNQDEEASSPSKRDRGNSNSVYHRAAMAAGGKAAQDNANVVTSLDKLMELEQRIRHLEDAGLAVDDLDDARDGNTSSRTAGTKQSTAGSGLRFAKRRATGGLHEPSRTVYAVTGPTKMRARDKTTVSSSRRTQGSTAAANAKKRALNNNTGARNRTKLKTDTFLTSLPESKQRQLRRMTERERRNFLKNEKAKEVRQQARKQDVVIEGWLEKKRAAANQRKATTSHVRAGAAAKSTTQRNQKQRLPPPPLVRAPALGAASGKRIANTHLQKLDDIKKGYTKRNEAFQRLPATTSNRPTGRFSTTTTNASRNQRSYARSAAIRANTRQTAGFGGSKLPPTRSAAAARTVASRQPLNQRGGPASGPIARQATSKLPHIQRNAAPRSSLLGATGRPGPGLIVGNSATLPRLSTQSRPAPMPSPPPAARSGNMPTFSRLHKRR
ncbi:hypothetical protein PC129_g4441 [Phytophthora cactorum]|uniref:Uncharacterized protein n=1 Tax=Phytophthora cactorum TaxID=29920 RepID=A0A329SXC5_9STRA|nr:hypothetical protein Pcac1_g5235 [Phytophthora cactorum]KAG2833379.1 hypothetical protein PC112_g6507 [Phytophthora cactorum]KAG2835857.1 hypothetical protein PC111_g5267 [Phytophthora cactorum]KAG2862005.1 hypothetical protein PC113_g6678 [Phytophthora cactorum]KAG2918813.1 hypothetical protein PC114_g6694 [Phytophthora cactorum]